MKNLIKGLLIFLVIIMTSFVMFYFWGSSKGSPNSAYYKLVTFSGQSAGKKDTLSVMTYNIGYLSGLDNNTSVRTTYESNLENLNKAIEVINDLSPDFIGFQEIDFASHRSYYLNQFDSIAIHAGFYMGAIAVNWDKKYVPFPLYFINSEFP